MIPKIIHYCWFGRKPKPKIAEKCINSWKKYCKNYKIIEWNEDNFDVSSTPNYVRQAYEAKKWAFVTDFVRLKVVYDYGGLYFDTDVQVIKPFDKLLKYHSFWGFENKLHIATGLGFGAEKNSELVKELMMQYVTIPFILEDGNYDYTPCPQRNTEVFVKYGLLQNGQTQLLNGNTLILSTDYLCPVDYETLSLHKTRKTYSIHWYEASWHTQAEKKGHKLDSKIQKKNNTIHTLKTIPNRVLLRILGEVRYDALKQRLKDN